MAGTISSAITFAVSSLQALNKQIGLTSNNISNATNDTYNYESANTQSQPIGGVLIAKTVRSTDDVLQRAELTATAQAGYAGQEKELADTIEGALGTSNGATILVDKFQKFQNTWQDFQATPEIVGVEKAVQNAGEDLVNEITRLNSFLNESQVKWNFQVRDQVNSVNKLLKDIYQLNFDVVYAQGHNGNVGSIQNERDSKLVELSKFLSFKTYKEENGAILVYNNSAALVSNNYAQFAYNENTTELLRTDIKITDDYARRVGGGSLEALLKGVSNRAVDIADPNPNIAIIEKLKTRLESLVYEFKETAKVHSDFSSIIKGADTDKLIQTNNGIKAGTFIVQLQLKGTGAPEGGHSVSVPITAATTIGDFKTALQTQLTTSNPKYAFEWTGRGQLIVKSTDTFDSNTFKIVINDNTGIFSSTNTIKNLQITDEASYVPNFASAYANAAVTAGRNELGLDYALKKVAVNPLAPTATELTNAKAQSNFFFTNPSTGFSLGNFSLNPNFSDRVDPPLIKRLAPNAIVDSLTSGTRNLINTGINIQNQSYLQIAIGVINNVLTQSKVISDTYKQYEQVRNETHIDLRQKVGVNLDSELSKLTVYQNSYAATARVISVSSELMQELINLIR